MPSLTSKFGNRTIKPAEVVEVTHANLNEQPKPVEKKEEPKPVETDAAKKAYRKSQSSKMIGIRFKNDELLKLEAKAKTQGISTAELIKTILSQNGAI